MGSPVVVLLMNHDHELVEIGDVKAVDKVEQALRSNSQLFKPSYLFQP